MTYANDDEIHLGVTPTHVVLGHAERTRRRNADLADVAYHNPRPTWTT